MSWRESVALPDLSLSLIKAKMDTGAHTSALYAFMVEATQRDGCRRLRFGLHPSQCDAAEAVFCAASVADERWVSDSGGHREWCMIIRTLLGHTAMAVHVCVNAARSFVSGRPKPRLLRRTLP